MCQTILFLKYNLIAKELWAWVGAESMLSYEEADMLGEEEGVQKRVDWVSMFSSDTI